MNTDDMKSEMVSMLNILYDTKGGEMDVEEIVGKLKLSPQDIEYFIEKLKGMGLIERLFIRGSDTSGYCTLTDDGRSYVKEKLRK